MDDRDGLGTGGRMVLAATVSAVVAAALVIVIGEPLLKRAISTPTGHSAPLVLTGG